MSPTYYFKELEGGNKLKKRVVLEMSKLINLLYISQSVIMRNPYNARSLKGRVNGFIVETHVQIWYEIHQHD